MFEQKGQAMNRLEGRLGSARLLPVLIIDRESDAQPLGEALTQGGLGTVEVTLRTPAALPALRVLRQNPQLVVGAGTVLHRDQAEQAIDAGAEFVVSPGFDRSIVDLCQLKGIPVVAGVATPTEVQRALRAGLTELKFFPAEALGGVTTLRAISAPFPDARWIPTGGINATNVSDYLQIPSVLAVGGSWMVDRALLMAGRFDEVQRLASEAVALSAGAAGVPA
jgi:2-dehydro-3-deoxyphosphogluconate aldolase/(4S)-4-hydroxy-2-oxoglutarate aldolase